MRKLLLIPVLFLLACEKTDLQCKDELFQDSYWNNDSMHFNNSIWFYNLNTTWHFTDEKLIITTSNIEADYSFKDECRILTLQNVDREIIFHSGTNFVLKSGNSLYYFSRQ